MLLCVCRLLLTKRPLGFSSFSILDAGGRGTHTNSSANKAGLYVVRISLGTYNIEICSTHLNKVGASENQ